MNIRDVLGLVPVVPVLTIHDLKHAVPLAQALCAGGLRVLEVTLRTPHGLKAIEAMRRAVPAAVVGVGTLTRPGEFAAAENAGAQFGVSPGLVPELAAAARAANFPLLPGVMTPADLISAQLAGFDTVKLFPATQAGGVSMVRALSDVFPAVEFCPTGGISPASARDYLALRSVPCVGGSWLSPAAVLQSGDWSAIEKLAQEAMKLRPDEWS